MPVLPLVGSTMVEPGFSTPRRSASSTMESAMRSFTLPAELSDSSLATTAALPGRGRRCSRTIGVPPMRSSTVSAIPLPLMTGLRPASDVVHGAGTAAPVGHAGREIREREAIHDGGHGVRHLVPQLGEIAATRVASPWRRVEGTAVAFDGTQDVAHREVLGTTREVIAARGPPPRRQDSRLLQREQHVLQIP